MAHSELVTQRQWEKSAVRSTGSNSVALNEVHLDEELALLYCQYLEGRNQGHLSRLIHDELFGAAKVEENEHARGEIERAIFDGEFGEIEGLLGRIGALRSQAQRAFLYLCYRQQFLEYIENRESQKAFNLLQKRLKPLEHYQPVPKDFYELAYLTSASTVHDAPSFRDWEGAGLEREKLVHVWRELVSRGNASHGGRRKQPPPDRLVTLLKQAAAYQVLAARSRSSGSPWTIDSLFEDYHIDALPTSLRRLVADHQTNVKCVDFLGPEDPKAVSGSSDMTLRIFSLDTGAVQSVMSGHTSRIWDCRTSPDGRYIASASGDGTVRIWSSSEGEFLEALSGGGEDVYGVCWKPNDDGHIATASYDRILRSWDVETGRQVRTFSGHSQSTLAVAFDHTGKIIASGAKDKQIRIWDAVGGMCAQTLSGCLGEITSVEFDSEGKYLLAGCKDNSNRLWDLRMQRNIYRYTGHQNTSKNLIRCSFARNCSVVVGGSEDGQIYMWDREPAHSPAPNSVDTDLHVRRPTHVLSPAASPRDPFHRTGTRVDAPLDIDRSSSGTNVRPLQIVEGHAAGAVFDVKWRGDSMISAGEDGKVAIWGVPVDNEDAA